MLESRRRSYCFKIVLTVKPGLHEYVIRKNELDVGMRIGSPHRSDRYAISSLMPRVDLAVYAHREQMSHQDLKPTMRQSSCLMTTIAMMKVQRNVPRRQTDRLYLLIPKLYLRS